MTAATEITLAEEMLLAARKRDILTTPFLQSVMRGDCPAEVLRAYFVRLYVNASDFPRTIATVLGICRHPEVRRVLIGNLLEEEGVVRYAPGSGVTVDARRSHGALARRLLRKMEMSDAEIDALPPVMVARWFEEALAQKKWLGAFAYFAVGYEANVPATFAALITPLRERYGFDDEELEFLIEHVSADVRHGEESAELIASIATTDELRAQAIDGARRGGFGWWDLHRSLMR